MVKATVIPSIAAIQLSQLDTRGHIPGYPDINMNRELFHATRVRDDKSVLVAVDETILKLVCRTYFEEGLAAALRQAAKVENCQRHPWAGTVAQCLLQVVEAGRRVKIFFRPYLQLQGAQCMSSFSQTRDWVKSPIRCIRWHPNCFKLAVVGADDSIRLYTDQQQSAPILKSGLQKGVSSLAWRPWSSSELAVGTQTGTILWTIENFLQNGSIKSQAVQLKHESHFPVTSVEWNSSGTLLATASVSEPDVLLWDVDQNRYTAIQRVGPPSAQLWWSPNSSFLCISTIGNSFRIWKQHVSQWDMDRWDIKMGRIQSVVWNQSHLLFCTTADNFLYSLLMIGDLFKLPQKRQAPVPIVDLTQEGSGIGGPVQSLALNRAGTLLAVSFKETDSIAILSVSNNKHNVLNVTPFGFINGLGDEFPSVINFEDPSERNVLTIGWSSGRVHYVPVADVQRVTDESRRNNR